MVAAFRSSLDKYVLREDFERIVGELNRQIEGLKEVMPYDATDGKPNVKK